MTSLTAVEGISQEMKDCIENCDDCRDICIATVSHCLNMGDAHADPQHIRTLLDCAEACQTSANFMLRNSPLHTSTCGVCSEACGACATSCEQISDGDAQMDACAEICRSCAESCEAMATAH